MLRTLKVTSPMSVGSWILVAFSAGAGVAAAGEVERALPGGGPSPVRVMRALVRRAEGAGGILAGLLAPGVASYTAVLLTNTAIPTWSGSREYLPFVFAGSAAMAAGGLAHPLQLRSHSVTHERAPESRKRAVELGLGEHPIDGGQAGVVHDPPVQVVAEADGNRTRLAGWPDHYGFEDRAGHQTRNASTAIT